MNSFNTEVFLKNTGLFWQYPVITEKEFYLQNKSHPNYVGVPWATCIDKKVNLSTLLSYISKQLNGNRNYYTCCQHIHFRKIIPLLKQCGIRVLYTPHKNRGEEYYGGVKLVACPLYAVNVEDPERNSDFQNVDFETCKRPYLYSFMGGYQENYLTTIRKKIFEREKHPSSKIINTGTWFFNSHVYSNTQNAQGDMKETMELVKKRKLYNELLLRSRYSLCPSGSGSNSIRFWESLAVGSIPVVLSDTMDLPECIPWQNAIVRIQESDLHQLEDILSGIDEEKEREMRRQCIAIYNQLKDNYKNCNKTIIHYCCGSYDIGDFGGVARYDYHLSLLYPHRIFIKGPERKVQLLQLLQQVDNPLVITDNHLASDIPNTYSVVLVHHGCALTHAEREPTWHPYWKNLCCNGQKQMLVQREPSNTKIISISTFCSDEFQRFFPDRYPLYDKTLIFHTSELNPKKYKKTFNAKPIIFGNFNSNLKGASIIQKLNKQTFFKIDKLNVSYDRIKDGSYEHYNERKQQFYLDRDIFLQLSLCEGNSYATLDAFLCGNVVVATNVGFTYKDVPKNCYVELDYTKINDLDYLMKKIQYAWEHREELSKNAREFYLRECHLPLWKERMSNFIKLN